VGLNPPVDLLVNRSGLGAFGQDESAETVKAATGIETVMATGLSRLAVHPLLSVRVRLGVKVPAVE